MTEQKPSDAPDPGPPRLVLYILGALTLAALLIGISTGVINENTLRPPPPSPSITIP